MLLFSSNIRKKLNCICDEILNGAALKHVCITCSISGFVEWSQVWMCSGKC